MSNSRPAIPEAIKREVRKRCYFGCVNCGNPIIEYHHIIPWNEVRKHEAENLTILCSNCHKKVTNGLISNEEVKEWNDNPYNKLKTYSPGEMLGYKLFGREDINKLQIKIGNTQFKISPDDVNLSHYMMIPILIDRIPLIAFTVINGKLNLYLKLFDEENNVAVEIVNNEIITQLNFWDITFKGNTLKINRKNQDVFIEIEFKVPYTIHIKRGDMIYNQKGFRIHSSYLTTYQNKSITLSNATIENFLVGIAMGETPESMLVGIKIE